MITTIVISLLALIVVVFTIFLRQRTPSERCSVMAPPDFKGGLFDQRDSKSLLEIRNEEIASQKKRLIERARTGDLNALSEAYSTHKPEWYAETLEGLIEWSLGGQERLGAIVTHISKSSELRTNKRLARLLMVRWRAAPNRRSTIRMIHIAALSDDPETYGLAVESTLELWRAGKLPWFTPDELAQLFVSQYWVIAPEARRGGPGFGLKRQLQDIRSELETAKSA